MRKESVVVLDTLAAKPKAYLLQAFIEVRDGFSSDRVIADPELDRRFLHRCRELGLSGTDFELNWKLFNARKDKLLANLPKTKQYTISCERRDEFEYASEIAVRYVQQANDYLSLDKIICDPILAAQFDDTARRLAPGFSSLEYRWVALGLRKAHRMPPESMKVTHPEFDLLGDTHRVRLNELPNDGGLYLFRSEDNTIFVGETHNLRHRIERHFESSQAAGFPDWLLGERTPMHLAVRPLPGVTQAARKAMELSAIRTLKPRFNYLDTLPDAA